jgi:hypothetical protein
MEMFGGSSFAGVKNPSATTPERFRELRLKTLGDLRRQRLEGSETDRRRVSYLIGDREEIEKWVNILVW